MNVLHPYQPLRSCMRGLRGPWQRTLARVACGVLASWGLLAQAGPTIERWTHANGAKIAHVAAPNLPMLDMQIDVDGGDRRDPAAQAGLASVTAWLLDKGTQATPGHPALDENATAEAWADLGAEFQASTSPDRLTVRLRTLTQPDLLQRAVALAARQLAAPAFDPATWARERERLTAAWQEAQTRPETHAQRRFTAAVYGNHPYGYEPRPETWNAIDSADLHAFYRQHARLCDARVTLVGAVDRTRADALVAQLLAGWQPHGCPSLPVVPEVAALTAAQNIRLPFASAQAHVYVGQPGVARSDPDYFALLVGNHILGGGGFTSRLMKEIRERRGLTYGVSSHFTPYRHAGAFEVGMQTRPDQAAQAVALIRQELQRFVQDGPTEAELKAAQAALINGFALRLDSNRKLLDNVANMAWHDLPANYLDTWPQHIARVTREQVRRAFQRVLQPDRMVTVVVGGTP